MKSKMMLFGILCAILLAIPSTSQAREFEVYTFNAAFIGKHCFIEVKGADGKVVRNHFLQEPGYVGLGKSVRLQFDSDLSRGGELKVKYRDVKNNMRIATFIIPPLKEKRYHDSFYLYVSSLDQKVHVTFNGDDNFPDISLPRKNCI